MDLTYTIRPSARWGDGMPATTADVLFPWEVGPANGAAAPPVG